MQDTWKSLRGNQAKVLCIDNWSEFGGPKDEFLTHFEKYKGNNDAHFIESDCFQVDVSHLPTFTILISTCMTEIIVKILITEH